MDKLKTKDVTAVVLAGSRDFGRCPIASRLPLALWPITGTPAIEILLKSLSEQGIKKIIICTNDDVLLLKNNINLPDSINVKFLEEKLPVGTAGCIRDAVNKQTKSLLLILPAAIVTPPDFENILNIPIVNGSKLTVVLQPSTNYMGNSSISNIFICEPEVLEHIPPEGYCDIKEGLIPALVQAGKTARTVMVKRTIGNFRNIAEYLQTIAKCLECPEDSCLNLPLNSDNPKGIWISKNAKIRPSVKIYGPVIILDNVQIDENAVIFGPTIIESGVKIGSSTLVESSVVWENALINNNCEIRNCVIDYDAILPSGIKLQGQAVTGKLENDFQIKNNKTQILSLF
ncbi:MAG: NDP-sugar synthase [Sedimentisphaerales bacterium]|nr:NDP-sugar synthase [Sedimentisphaerales bacterium]